MKTSSTSLNHNEKNSTSRLTSLPTKFKQQDQGQKDSFYRSVKPESNNYQEKMTLIIDHVKTTVGNHNFNGLFHF